VDARATKSARTAAKVEYINLVDESDDDSPKEEKTAGVKPSGREPNLEIEVISLLE
jgi:hypothetical protein